MKPWLICAAIAFALQAVAFAGGGNTDPNLDSTKSPEFDPVFEDAALPSGAVGTPVSSLVDFAIPAGQVDNVTDPDVGALLGIAVSAVDTNDGSLFYSLNGGANWSAVPAISPGNALLLAADGSTRLYFQPNANFSGVLSSAITIHAWDRTTGSAGTIVSIAITGGGTAFSANFDTVSLLVNAVNDAPVLDSSKSPALNSELEDAGPPVGAVGTPVSSLVDFASPAGQLDNITDVDAGALLGIAVTGADTSNGAWFFTTDGGTNWYAIGGVSDSNARFLATNPGDRLYFQPNTNFNGVLTSAITFRAWDRTSFVDGNIANTSPNGGTNAFSTATDTASLTVVYLPPVIDIPGPPTNALITSDSTPSFVFTVSEGAEPYNTACRIDANAFAPATSPFTATTLSDGPHTFEAKVTDASNNVAVTSFVFIVDTIAPVVTIPAPPMNAVYTSDTTPSFAFSVSPGGSMVTTMCKVDSGSYVTSSSPFTVAFPIPDGPHTFYAQATDGAGNVGISNFPFTVDTFTPVVTIADPPTNALVTSDITPTFVFDVSPDGAPVTTECKIDGAIYAPGTSPFTVALPLTVGPHTFYVQATDAANNVGNDNFAFTVHIEPVATNMTLQAGGVIRIDFYGEPGALYDIQVGSTLIPNIWQHFGIRTADVNGAYSITDPSPTNAVRSYTPIIPEF